MDNISLESYVLLAFLQYSQVRDRNEGLGEMYKNVTVDPRKTDVPQHAVQRRHHGDHRLVGIQIHNNSLPGESGI